MYILYIYIMRKEIHFRTVLYRVCMGVVVLRISHHLLVIDIIIYYILLLLACFIVLMLNSMSKSL